MIALIKLVQLPVLVTERTENKKLVKETENGVNK